MKSKSLFALASLILFPSLSASPASAAIIYAWADGFHWPGGNGLEDRVLALTTGNIGGGSVLFAGGWFTNAGGISANRIAQWNGTTWSALGSGIMGTEVTALAVFDDDGNGLTPPDLYAGGAFNTAGGISANNIAKWNGTIWSALGSGTDGDVEALIVFDDGDGPALYAGGHFSTAGGVIVSGIAKWDGANWSALGTGTNNEVKVLAVFDDDGNGPSPPDLYAGGWFSTAGGITVNGIAKWDGANWSALGSGTSNVVYALGVFDDGFGGGPALYVGGFFTTAGGLNVQNIAKWDGATWSALGSGANGQVYAFAVYDEGEGSALYVGGQFSPFDVGANNIAKWDGVKWSPLRSGITHYPLALSVFEVGSSSTLYAGGHITMANGQPSANIAQWRGKPCLNDNHCNDQLHCNGVETCDLGPLHCVTGTPPSCPVPTPLCDEATDTCVGCITTGCPDDGLYCNGTELCNLAGHCKHGGVSCPPNQRCDEDTDQCLIFGACCLDGGSVCFEFFGTNEATNEGLCEDPEPFGAGGTYLGAGSTCPHQNAAIIPEGNGTVFVHVVGPPVNCPIIVDLGRSTMGCPPSGPYTDPWVSEESAAMCHHFGSPDTDAIPAGFFGSGSDPFTSSVCLRGVPLGIEEYGDADTLITRDADPFDRCDLPSGESSTVNIEIVALSLEGTGPITVTHNGGSNPETWNVTVDLSPGGLPPATPPRTLTATKTHCNGGTYTSVLYVQPRFTFTKVSNPSDMRVLDTRIMGTPPVALVQSDPHPWVSDVHPFLGAMVDLCSDFHANISESSPLPECDCNANSRRDLCDIEEGTTQDCNANLMPDECDIDDGTSDDANGNNIPDECELQTPTVGDNTCQTAGADLGTPCSTNADCTAAGSACGNKSRYISITPTNSGSTSIQVEIVTFPQFPSMVGDIYYASPEQNIPNAPNPAQRGALLQCTVTPNAQVWTSGVLHLFGQAIVPSSTYNVRMCDPSGGICSAPLLVATGKWGDVIRAFGGGSQPNFADINSIVQKFIGLASAPAMPRADLAGVGNPGTPNTPNQVANFADISNDVSAFSGFPYPFTVTACP